MSNTTLPETSHEAHKMVTPEMLTLHHQLIILALKNSINQQGTYEQIAFLADLDRHQVGRRLKELENFQPHPLIYNTKEKKKTSTGRNAYVYKLVENN